MRQPTILLLVFSLAACADKSLVSPTGGNVTLPANAVALGKTAFSQECAPCHSSADAVDLAFFHFTDTTIIRRAVAHVDTATARNIVAYVHTLGTRAMAPEFRLFQPGGVVLGSDAEFAMRLFGADAFPANMTTQQMTAIDPRTVAVALKMPLWSDEATNQDWMPDHPVPDAILDDQGSAPRAAIAGYRAAPTIENLTRAVMALRNADHRTANMSAPCLLEDLTRVDFLSCFQVRRWTSTLVAQHMIRMGIDGPIAASLHDVWWDVGNAARKSLQGSTTSPVENAVINWASWMYLGFTFDPGGHPSVYTGGGPNRLGQPRLATFIALRSQVARAKGAGTPYADASSAANFAPNTWAYNVTSYSFRHLLDRLNAGDVPSPTTRAEAREKLSEALSRASRKVSAAERAALTAQYNEIAARL